MRRIVDIACAGACFVRRQQMVLRVKSVRPSTVTLEVGIAVVEIAATTNGGILIDGVGDTVVDGACCGRVPQEKSVADILARQLVHFVVAISESCVRTNKGVDESQHIVVELISVVSNYAIAQCELLTARK